MCGDTAEYVCFGLGACVCMPMVHEGQALANHLVRERDTSATCPSHQACAWHDCRHATLQVHAAVFPGTHLLPMITGLKAGGLEDGELVDVVGSLAASWRLQFCTWRAVLYLMFGWLVGWWMAHLLPTSDLQEVRFVPGKCWQDRVVTMPIRSSCCDVRRIDVHL